MSLELPFVKFKYLKVDKGQPEKPKYSKTIDVRVPSESKPAIATSRVIVSREAEVTTFGADPMVSNPSVLHELNYGRIDMEQGLRQDVSYRAVYEPQPHSLDFII